MTARLAAVLLLAACTPAARAARSPEPRPERPRTERHAAVVDASHEGTDGTLVGGVPAYRTLGAALAAAPADAKTPHVIFIRNGRYREKLSVDKPNIALVGESRDGVVLTFDAAADTPRPEGGTYGTRGSFTLRVTAPGFRVERLTIENAFDYAANAARAADDPARYRNTQGVALMLDGGSDRAVVLDCTISGHQDTLFANAGRLYVARSTILGHVDFIFGAGRAVFEECEIVSRDRGLANNNGYIVAPSTPVSQPYGFLFLRSRLQRDRVGLAAGSVLLGRPWHPGADPEAVGSAVFLHCWMDDHIAARGWERMSSVNPAGERVWFEPHDARLFEYGSVGPGAIAHPARRVLTETEAARYTVAAVLDGWNPSPKDA